MLEYLVIVFLYTRFFLHNKSASPSIHPCLVSQAKTVLTDQITFTFTPKAVMRVTPLNFFSKIGVERLRTWHVVQVMFRWWFHTHFFVLTPGGNDPYISQVGGSTATSQATDQGATATIPANLYTMAQLPCLVGDETMTWIFSVPVVNWWIGGDPGVSKSKKLKNKYQALCLKKNYSFNEVGFTFQSRHPLYPLETRPQKWHLLRWWLNFKLRCSHEVR